MQRAHKQLIKSMSFEFKLVHQLWQMSINDGEWTINGYGWMCVGCIHNMILNDAHSYVLVELTSVYVHFVYRFICILLPVASCHSYNQRRPISCWIYVLRCNSNAFALQHWVDFVVFVPMLSEIYVCMQYN